MDSLSKMLRENRQTTNEIVKDMNMTSENEIILANQSLIMLALSELLDRKPKPFALPIKPKKKDPIDSVVNRSPNEPAFEKSPRQEGKHTASVYFSNSPCSRISKKLGDMIPEGSKCIIISKMINRNAIELLFKKEAPKYIVPGSLCKTLRTYGRGYGFSCGAFLKKYKLHNRKITFIYHESDDSFIGEFG